MPVPLHGQVAVSGSAQPLSPTPVAATAFIVKASVNNINSVYLGASGVTTSTGHEMAPGEYQEYERNNQHGQTTFQLNIQDIYVVGTAPDKVTWFASPRTD